MWNSHAIWDRTVLPAIRKRCESRLYLQPKQVLDLATLGMQGWVDLCYVKSDRLGFEPATCQSQVQRPTAAPTRDSSSAWITGRHGLPGVHSSFVSPLTAVQNRWSKGIDPVCIVSRSVVNMPTYCTSLLSTILRAIRSLLAYCRKVTYRIFIMAGSLVATKI